MPRLPSPSLLLALLLAALSAQGAGTLLDETAARLDSLGRVQGRLAEELAGLARREAGGVAELDRLAREEAATRDWLAGLDEERRVLEARDAELLRRQAAGAARLDSLDSAAGGAGAARDSLRAEASAFARTLYPLRRLDPWTWLLSAESARQGLKRLRGWPWIHEALGRRLDRLADLETRLHSLADEQRRAQDDLASVRDALQAGRRRNAENRLESERGLEKLASSRAERRRALASIRSEKEGRAALARRAEEAGQQVGDLLASLREQWRVRESGRESERRRLAELGERLGTGGVDERTDAGAAAAPREEPAGGGLSGLRGRLPRPVPGRLSRAHGLRTDPALGTTLDNPGADYAVAPGAAVRAVHAGRVERIVWVPGYGNTVLVGHAGGGWTVYARLEALEVREGQALESGARLGRAGEAEEGGAAGFHFELWIGDQAQDPEAWFQR